MQDLPFNPLRHPAIFTLPEYATRVRECSEHIPFAAFAISVLRPKLVVELGTVDGDFYSAMCQVVKEQGLEADCYAVVDKTLDAAQADLRDYHQNNFGAFSHFILSEEAAAYFPDGSIDLLHINVAHDGQRLFVTWTPKLSRQGVVMIQGQQTTRQAKRRNDFQAAKALARAHFEFIHGGGFKVLAVGEAVSEEFLEFLTAAVEEPEKTRGFFANLGRALAERLQARRQLGALSGENDELKVKLAQTERTLKLVNERLEARTREIETVTTSLSYKAKTRILSVYMRLPYRLR
ncbi:MAG: class I SAM-dependent methyltransferase, partial [Blastocatellia bacterium]